MPPTHSVPPLAPEAAPFSDEYTLLALVALQHLEGLGPIRLGRLLEQTGGVAPLLRAGRAPMVDGIGKVSAQRLAQFLYAPERSPAWASAERTLDWLCHRGGVVLCKGDRRFPRLLSELPDCPQVLYARGDTSLLETSIFSIVGTRRPTRQGVAIAFDFAKELGERGLTIASGMALGVDAAAHRGALAAGGCTVAVWATGLDEVYPRQHARLAKEISEHGCIVSEMPLGTRSSPRHFPRRNRIVSGLSCGVLIVEAAVKSGSLITARYALEQNREVFAVPGSIHNPLSKGCHHLIREGAKLTESVEDIFAEIAALDPRLEAHSALRAPLSPAEVGFPSSCTRSVYQQIDYSPTSYEQIVAQLESDTADLAAALLELELCGLIEIDGGLYQRTALVPKDG